MKVFGCLQEIIGEFIDNKFLPNDNFLKLKKFHLENNNKIKVMINIPQKPINGGYYTYYSFAENPTERTILYWSGNTL